MASRSRASATSRCSAPFFPPPPACFPWLAFCPFVFVDGAVAFLVVLVVVVVVDDDDVVVEDVVVEDDDVGARAETPARVTTSAVLPLVGAALSVVCSWARPAILERCVWRREEV